jgi:hypothetical protein
MSQNLDLKAIERKAVRSTYQDGLWDLYIGGLLLLNFLFFNVRENEEIPPLTLWLTLFGVGVTFALFWLGKKYVTTPRLGQVKFGPERIKRKHTLAMILGFYLLVTIGLVIFTLLAQRNVSSLIANLGTDRELERLILAAIVALLVGSSMILIAYFNDFTRGYYIALMMGCGFFFTELLDTPVPVGIAAALIILPGLALFVNFLRQHPLPPREISHGNS